VRPNLSVFEHADLWAFYTAIGYDHKTKKAVRALA